MYDPKHISKNKQQPSCSTWHSRGYLPHFDSETATQGVTFRLFDSVPHSLIERLKREEARSQNPDAEVRILLEKYSDAGYGACYLRNHVSRRWCKSHCSISIVSGIASTPGS